MERNAAAALSNCRKLVWIAIGYVAVIAVVVYPAIHEEVGARVLVWNCIPPTLSLLVIATAFHKSETAHDFVDGFCSACRSRDNVLFHHLVFYSARS